MHVLFRTLCIADTEGKTLQLLLDIVSPDCINTKYYIRDE